MSRTKNIESEPDIRLRYEMKYLFFGFIIAIGVAIVFIHILLFITNEDRYIGTTSAVLLGSASFLLLFTILSNPRNKEVQRFMLLFIGLTLWFLGESSYSYYQIVLNMEVPFPGVGEIFYLAGYGPIILFAYRSFKTINRDGIIKPRVIAFVIILTSVIPVTSTILIFSQEVDFQSQWPDIVISTITNCSDIFLLSLSILILTKLPRNNPYIYHWILFTSFMILTVITDFGYLYIAIVDEEFLTETELIWEALWAFAYLSVLASAFWYYKLTHILGEDLKYPTTEDKNELLDKKQLHTGNILDFKLVESHIDEIIRGAKNEITILFCNTNTLKRKEIQSILKCLKEKTKSNILVRILFPLGVDDGIVDSYSEVASVRNFERKLENNDIIIVSDYINMLLVSTTDTIDYDKETAYALTYSDDEERTYTYVTMFEKLWLLQTVTKLEVR
ncbi:MAG TPA: hypothetical protein VFY68_10185 [Nitrososphaeraceae archaeon]|nr:hypothetical protein [Nitrososphaeraceae archaeon]